jgi:hypothetical protein
MRGLARSRLFKEVGDLMHERVLVADLQARDPPVVHVGLIAVGDVNGAPAADDRFVAVIEVLQAMQVVQVPLERRKLAVDFEVYSALCPRRSGSIRISPASRFEVAEEGTGVVDANRFLLPVSACIRSLTKVSVMADVADRTVEPHGGVDAVGQQVAGHAAEPAASTSSRQSGGATLRDVLGDRPVLQEVGAVVEDPPQPPSSINCLASVTAGHAAIVVPDHVGHARLFDGSAHLLPSATFIASGFSHRIILPAWAAAMAISRAVVGHADIDRVDVVPLQQLAPIALDRLVAPRWRQTRPPVSALRAQAGLENRFVLALKKWGACRRRSSGLAHEAVADHADTKVFHVCCSLWQKLSEFEQRRVLPSTRSPQKTQHSTQKPGSARRKVRPPATKRSSRGRRAL